MSYGTNKSRNVLFFIFTSSFDRDFFRLSEALFATFPAPRALFLSHTAFCVSIPSEAIKR